jgi:hypothetical protein
MTTYFRKLFENNPDLLGPGTNDAVLELWRAAHPGQEPDQRVKNILANVKSTMRKAMAKTRRGQERLNEETDPGE